MAKAPLAWLHFINECLDGLMTMDGNCTNVFKLLYLIFASRLYLKQPLQGSLQQVQLDAELLEMPWSRAKISNLQSYPLEEVQYSKHVADCEAEAHDSRI